MATYSELAALIMRHMCEHDGDGGHGYSQPHRNGDGTIEWLKIEGWSFPVPNGDSDCSKACIACYEALGVDCGGATYTGNMRSCMTSTGNFKAIKRPTSYSAQPGDIYLNEAHHAAMCLTSHADGDLLGQFSISETGGVDGKQGDQTGKESNIRAFYDYPWDYTIVCTLGEYDGSDGSAGSNSSGFGDENWWGPLMAKEFIRQLTGGADSFLSGQAVEDKEAFWAVSGGVEYGRGGSDAVRALQRALGVDADGYYGAKSIRAHQQALKDAGYYAGDVDGYHGTQTNAAVCSALKAEWYAGL